MLGMGRFGLDYRMRVGNGEGFMCGDERKNWVGESNEQRAWHFAHSTLFLSFFLYPPISHSLSVRTFPTIYVFSVSSSYHFLIATHISMEFPSKPSLDLQRFVFSFARSFEEMRCVGGGRSGGSFLRTEFKKKETGAMDARLRARHVRESCARHSCKREG